MSVCLLLVSALWAAPAAQAAPAPSLTAPDRLSGIWMLNKDLSTAPPAGPEAGRGDADRGGGARGGGQPGGVGGRRGGGMGSGFGGRGGRGGDGGGAAARVVFEEFGRAPGRWLIARTAEAVSLTDPDGVVRRFTSNGKKEKVAINGASVEVKTGWDHDVLSQTVKAGDVTMTRQFETTTDGHQLVITVTRKGGPAGDLPPLRYVYDRGETP